LAADAAIFIRALRDARALIGRVFEVAARRHLTSRCSRRRAGVLSSFHMIKTLQLAATRAPARRG
jgi:hypothetical protein